MTLLALVAAVVVGLCAFVAPLAPESRVFLGVSAVVVALVPLLLPVLQERVAAARLREETVRKSTVTLGRGKSLFPLVGEVPLEELGVKLGGWLFPYVERDVDWQVRGLLCRERPRPILLVGASLSGKSRTAAEALRAHFAADFTMFVPPLGQPIGPLLDAQVSFEKVVVWLDDLGGHLAEEGQDWTIAHLNNLLSEGAVVVGTINRQAFDALQATVGQSTRAAQFLAGFDVINVERLWTEAELDRLHEVTGDPRFLDGIPLFGLAEHLGGGPVVVATLEELSRSDPLAYAVVRAVADWRRSGLRRATPTTFITESLREYLGERPDVEVGPGQVASAIATVRAVKNEHPGLLQYVRDDSRQGRADEHNYWISDYVVDHFDAGPHATPVPRRVRARGIAYAKPWESGFVAATALLAGELQAAVSAARKEASQGVPESMAFLGSLLWVAGEDDEAIEWMQGAVDGGDADALVMLGGALMSSDPPRAERLLRRAVDEEVEDAKSALGGFLFSTGRREDGLFLLEQAQAEGSSSALSVMDNIRVVTGESRPDLDAPPAEDLLLWLNAGSPRALCWQAALAEVAGDNERAKSIYRRAAAQADDTATATLAAMLRAEDREDEALEFLRPAVDRNQPRSMVEMGRVHSKAGQDEDAASLYERAADLDNPQAMRLLADIKRRNGDVRGASALYERAATFGDHSSLNWLGVLAEQAGDAATAKRLYELAVGAGSKMALSNLAGCYERLGDRETAEQFYRAGAETLSPAAMFELGRFLHLGDAIAESDEWFHRVRDPSNTSSGLSQAQVGRYRAEALKILVVHAVNRGAWEDAEGICATAGITEKGLKESLRGHVAEERGDLDTADRRYQSAVDSGYTYGFMGRGSVAERRGDKEGAEHYYQLADNAGERTAGEALRKLREGR